MEFSEENLEFWIACEEYKQQKSAKLEARANKIFTDFVAVQAPREVSKVLCIYPYIACCAYNVLQIGNNYRTYNWH